MIELIFWVAVVISAVAFIAVFAALVVSARVDADEERRRRLP